MKETEKERKKERQREGVIKNEGETRRGIKEKERSKKKKKKKRRMRLRRWKESDREEGRQGRERARGGEKE